MRRTIILMLLTAVLAGAAPFGVFAAEYVTLSSGGFAVVEEVIDGQTLKVRPQGTTDCALVSLIGVDASGSSKAFDYLNTWLTGKTVVLTFDALIQTPSGRFNMLYAACDGVSVNSTLLQKGYAKANGAHERASMFSSGFSNYYSDYNGSDSYGYSDYYDYYGYNSDSYDDYNYYGSGININTATADQLESILVDVSWRLAERIVEYRDDNGYFGKVSDIKNVSGMSDSLYDKNYRYMAVCTNINTATRQELLTLGIDRYDADAIIEYRREQSFDRKSELYTESVISRSTYDDISLFVDVKDKRSI